MGIAWEVSFADFLLVTIFLGGGAAYLTGRAAAGSWLSIARLAVYIVLLTAAARFIHFALFAGTLLSLHYYIVDLIVLLFFAALGFRITRTRQMVGQYHWLYERTTPISWRPRHADGDQEHPLRH